MNQVLYHPKVKPEHLCRKAVVYIRQSSDKQVRQNKESQRLQYDVAERMRNLGWNEVEYTGLNENFHNRGKRIEEQVALLRALWTEPLVNFKGRWHYLPDVGLNPLPIQRPIPIWFGGHSEAQLCRAANLGDGWMPKAKEKRTFVEGKGEGGAVAFFRSVRLGPTWASRRGRLTLCGCLALVVVTVAGILSRSGSRLPPPVVAFLDQSNGPVRVFFGSEWAGLILPDDSLWRWGKTGAPAASRAPGRRAAAARGRGW